MGCAFEGGAFSPRPFFLLQLSPLPGCHKAMLLHPACSATPQPNSNGAMWLWIETLENPSSFKMFSLDTSSWLLLY